MGTRIVKKPTNADIEELRSQLDRARTSLDTAQRHLDICNGRSETATPGWLTGYDPGILSGISRKPNRKRDDRRFNAYDNAARAQTVVGQRTRDVETLERQIARAVRDAAASCDIGSLAKGDAVRDRYGWHRVVTVNKVSVSVETGYDWTDLIRFDRIIETRKQPTG